MRNPLKKVVRNSEFGKGRYDQNNYQKSVFYTGWLDEPAESAEPAANQPTSCKKFWKFYRMFLEEYLIPSLDEGDTIKTSSSAPNLNMPL